MVEIMIQWITDLDSKLELLMEQEEIPLEAYKQAMSLTASCCNKFNTAIIDYEFQAREEEVFIFKELKPKLYSSLFYYNALFYLECEKPLGVINQKKYLEKKLNRIDKHLELNIVMI